MPDWLLICYHVPNQPSALRVATWRALKQRGAILLGPGTYALPDIPTHRKALEALTERIVEGGGTAISFSAAALADPDRRALELKSEAARHDDYRQVVRSTANLIDHIEREESEHDYRFVEVEALEEELAKVRRQLAHVIERDTTNVPSREEAVVAVRAAETRLQRYMDNAYREENAE